MNNKKWVSVFAGVLAIIMVLSLLTSAIITLIG